MDNLQKLADCLINEADKLAGTVLHDPGKHLREIDIIVQFCNAHTGICESLEIDEKFDTKSGGLFSDRR